MLASAWELEPGSALAGFVASRYDRIAGRLGLLTQRWAILRSFTVEPLLPLLKAGAYAAGIALEIHLGEFNAYAQEILDPESALYRFQPDVVVLAVQTRDVAPDLWRGESAGGGRSGALRRTGSPAFRSHSNAALIVHSLEVPASPPPASWTRSGRQSRPRPSSASTVDLRALAGRASRRLHPGLRRAGGAPRPRPLGRRAQVAHRPPAVASANLPHLAAEWLRFLHPLAGKVAKCVAVDLDNTLWGGVIGEDGMTGIRLGAEYPGAAFQELQRALLDLTRRGILLAVCSKNNPADAMEALPAIRGCCSSPRDFAAMRINWNDKAQNLREIAAELNIGLDAMAFLDDNPVERQHVREQAPEAIVIHLPEDPMDYAQAVRDCPWFERLDPERGRPPARRILRRAARARRTGAQRHLQGGFLPLAGTGGGNRRR